MDGLVISGLLLAMLIIQLAHYGAFKRALDITELNRVRTQQVPRKPPEHWTGDAR